MRLIHRETVGSTQDEARSLYKSGERGPLWLSAEAQTGGRGRRGRHWVSVKGNLFATGIWPVRSEPAESALYGFAAAVALAKTIEHYEPIKPVSLKWPNDVLIGGAKISGILIEREAEALLIGTGLNLVSHPYDTPYPATHLLAEMNPDALDQEEPLYTGADAVLAVLATELSAQFRNLEMNGFEPIRQAWLSRAHHLSEIVEVNGVRGKFTNLGSDGALCLTLADGTTQRVHAGDVSFG